MLRRQVGGTATMRAQLNRLRDTAALPNVTAVLALASDHEHYIAVRDSKDARGPALIFAGRPTLMPLDSRCLGRAA